MKEKKMFLILLVRFTFLGTVIRIQKDKQMRIRIRNT